MKEKSKVVKQTSSHTFYATNSAQSIIGRQFVAFKDISVITINLLI